MKNLIKDKDFTIPAFFAILIIVAIIKIPHLVVPHFWDEAWSYSPAIQYMFGHKPGMLPSALPPEYGKGHPLLFFFLSATWMRIFGDSLLAKHCFALFISCLLLGSLFYTVRKLFSKSVAIYSVMFVALQTVFLAQSSMLLPEVMLSLFTIWTLYFYLKYKPAAYMIAGILLILTKESGIFLILVIWTVDLLFFFTGKNYRQLLTKQILKSFILAVPVLVYFVFLTIQKFTYGWFFYPEHISLITTFSEGIRQLGKYARSFFILDGRIYLTISFGVSLLIQLFLRNPVSRNEKQSMILMTVFIAFFILVSSFLTFSARYLLCINVTMAIVTAFFIDLLTRRIFLLNLFFPVFITGILFLYSLFQRLPYDTDLGYLDSTGLQKMAIQYFESNGLTHKRIYAHFVLRRDMLEKSAGYIKGEPFSNICTDPLDHPDYIISSNIFYDPKADDPENIGKFDHIQYFEIGWMNLTIYRRK